MKKLILLAIGLTLTLSIASTPLLKNNGFNTDFSWYSNKYEGFWELKDSVPYNLDTVFIFKLNAQKFVFGSDGKLIENYKF